ncbi:MAG: hypothetical protein J6X86_03335 [Bacteroidales bacterium]|nr:hypothetical protein [Bacteroidales bacterium]
MKVDYVPQMLDIQRYILAQAETAKAMWQDEVSERYYRSFIEDYDKDINTYLRGGPDIAGLGLEDLLEFFERKLEEMSKLTGCSNPNYTGDSDPVCDDCLNRNMEGFDASVPNPSYLDQKDVHDIEEKRSENDRRNEMESPFQSFGR